MTNVLARSSPQRKTPHRPVAYTYSYVLLIGPAYDDYAGRVAMLVPFLVF